METNKQVFKQNKLSYDYSALEPYIDAQTMQIHYEKHHAAYTEKFNTALSDVDNIPQNISEIFANISKYSIAVRNNGGGYFNHNLYWSILTPSANSNPNESLEVVDAINTTFGSLSEFKKEFSNVAATRFGSGWAWLSVDSNGNLFVSSTANQDNPLMNVVEKQGVPILTIDVWEHAYYLKYQNKRPDYISAFFNVINWEEVNKLYKEAVI
ncbi:MAG: superoxide dismutase [Bacteroidales bacterium]|nr:superoxide dismutase [Bacteroidales bacterium]